MICTCLTCIQKPTWSQLGLLQDQTKKNKEIKTNKLMA